MATTQAIKRREAFDEEVTEERAALETFANELTEIDSEVAALPECSPRRQSLESLLDLWESYDALFERCELLLARRQRQFTSAYRTTPHHEDVHGFNEYLYAELDSPYPVLSAIAATCERIEWKRGSNQSPVTLGRSLEA